MILRGRNLNSDTVSLADFRTSSTADPLSYLGLADPNWFQQQKYRLKVGRFSLVPRVFLCQAPCSVWWSSPWAAGPCKGRNCTVASKFVYEIWFKVKVNLVYWDTALFMFCTVPFKSTFWELKMDLQPMSYFQGKKLIRKHATIGTRKSSDMRSRLEDMIMGQNYSSRSEMLSRRGKGGKETLVNSF